MRVFGYIKLLPLLILVAMLSFAVRVGDFASGLSQMGAAHAEQVAESLAEDSVPAAEAGHDATSHDEQAITDEALHQEMMPPPIPGGKDAGEAGEWRDAGDAAFEYSEVREELYRDLVSRRKYLEAQEKEMARKQALLVAAERELDQKLREMTALRNEIEELLKQQSAEEQARINSLVKIYEGMKAKDAAGIFNTLDMDVLIDIMARMSERKSAPILAEMNPERARNVTILLAQQKKLPEFPEEYVP